MSRRQHRDRNQGSRADRANAQQPSCAHFLQKRGTDEATNHRAAPVESDEAGRNFFRQAANLRLAEVVHQKTSNRNLAADVDENADRAKNQARVLPDRVVHLLADFVLSMLDRRQLETADRDRQHDQRNAQAHIRRLDGRGFMQAVGLQRIGRHRSDFLNGLGRGAQNQQPAEKRRQESAQRVERLCQIQPARSRLRLSQHRDIRIRRHLQAGNPSRKNDQRTQK